MTKVGMSAVVTFLFAAAIWFVATYFFSTTCRYDTTLHADAVCVDSVSELLSNPDVFDATLVVVSGEFGFPLEGHYVRDQLSDTRIWLSADLAVIAQHQGNCGFKGQLKGVFTAGKSGHLGHFPGKLTLLELLSLDEENARGC